MTTLYLTRHGVTEDNDAQLLQGIRPGRLTAQGVAQMEQLAASLAGRHLDAIVASDLQRAIDSAAVIATPRAMDVATTPLLRERDWGAFTGRFIPDLQGLPLPPDIESIEHMLDRARRFVAWVLECYPGQTVLAVGHGIICRAVQAVATGTPMHQVPKMGNAECRVLSLTDAPAAAVSSPGGEATLNINEVSAS